jgi:hypothetical protein
MLLHDSMNYAMQQVQFSVHEQSSGIFFDLGAQDSTINRGSLLNPTIRGAAELRGTFPGPIFFILIP